MNYKKNLNYILAIQSQALQRHDLESGESVWVRKINKSNPSWRYGLWRILTKNILCLPLLQPAYRGAKQSIEDEVKRLQELREVYLPVPNLLAWQENGLMMSDLSVEGKSLTSLADILDQKFERQESVFPLWKKGLFALSIVHEKQQYLSQAFVRNFLYSDVTNQFYFNDFEEDPAFFMSLEECQIRDYLFFLHSSVYLLEQSMEESINYTVDLIKKYPTSFQEKMKNTLKSVQWTRYLAFLRYGGRDGYRAHIAILFLRRLYLLIK